MLILMHMYQKHILDLLRKHDLLRYSQLQPIGVESSHFKYHLNQLIQADRVSQLRRGVYELTTDGASMLDRMSEHSVIAETTPKVITYILLEDVHSYYFQLKNKQPYKGLLNMVGGKVHYGESSREAAGRELHEKANFDTNNLNLRAIAEIRVLRSKKLYTHAVAYIYDCHDLDGLDIAKFVAVDKNDLLSLDNAAPDLIQIVESLKPEAVVTLDISVDY